MAPKSVDIPRLCQAMQKARLALRYPRTVRKELTRQFVGKRWSEEGTKQPVPVNLLALYVQIVGRTLIPKNPRVMLSTFDRSLKPTISAMQTWANQQIERMGLDETLKRVVVDGLFGIGICKVAIADPSQSAAFGWAVPAGAAFCEQVDLDDFVYDIHARDFRQCSYIGHRYRVPLDVVKDAKLFGKARNKLVPSVDQPYNQEGDERISLLGRTNYTNQDEGFEDYVDLWEVYLPRKRLVVTLADDQLIGAQPGDGTEPLRVQQWIGPDCGPYHILGYQNVPGNAMPKAPLQDLADLHEAANRGYRKIIRTLDRIKEITAVAQGATEDAARVLKADDGEIIRVDHPEMIKQFVTSGSSLQSVVAISTTLKDTFSWVSGNLDMLGGLSPQSKTVGQDKLLAENSSRTINDLQETTIKFVGDVTKSLCWYWWHDPAQVQKSIHSLPGLPDIQTVRKVTPKDRQQGKYEDLDIRIDPYSMQPATPQSRIAALNQVVTQIVIPMMTLMVQQGISFDINAYLSKLGQYMDLPDLGEVLTIMEPNQQQTVGASTGGATKPAQTERTYNRTNTPGQTREASDRNLVASMLGHNLGGNPNGTVK